MIDASVAIKWVIEEPGTAEALALRHHRLLSTDLLIAKCANILWKKVRRQEIGPNEAALAARLLQRGHRVRADARTARASDAVGHSARPSGL